MATATLTKWGNSQGVTIPKALCNALGWRIGDKVEISRTDDGTVELRQAKRRFARTRKLTIEEVFEGYEGTYDPPRDFPHLGNEVDWGQPVGRELW